MKNNQRNAHGCKRYAEQGGGGRAMGARSGRGRLCLWCSPPRGQLRADGLGFFQRQHRMRAPNIRRAAATAILPQLVAKSSMTRGMPDKMGSVDQHCVRKTAFSSGRSLPLPTAVAASRLRKFRRHR
jgi:hypothetical protein